MIIVALFVFEQGNTIAALSLLVNTELNLKLPMTATELLDVLNSTNAKNLGAHAGGGQSE